MTSTMRNSAGAARSRQPSVVIPISIAPQVFATESLGHRHSEPTLFDCHKTLLTRIAGVEISAWRTRRFLQATVAYHPGSMKQISRSAEGSTLFYEIAQKRVRSGESDTSNHWHISQIDSRSGCDDQAGINRQSVLRTSKIIEGQPINNFLLSLSPGAVASEMS